jgi:hypothetical protein
MRAYLAFEGGDLALEKAVLDAHHHVAVHVEEAAVRVECECGARLHSETLLAGS